MEITLIDEWKEAKAKLTHYKAEEIRLRNEICDKMFEGSVGWFTSKATIGEYELTAKSKSKYKIDSDKLKMLGDTKQLTQTDVDCFKPKVELIESKIKKLSEASNLWQAIETSPATPELTLKEVMD